MPKKTDTNIEDFPINGRTKAALTKVGIHKASDFINYSAADLKKIEGLGPVLLLELKDYLKGAKIKLKKREPAAKKAPKYDPATKEIMLNLLQGQVTNFGMDMKYTGLLIERFGAETVRNACLPPHIQPPRLNYFFTGGRIAAWCDQYFAKFAPIRLVEEEKVDKEPEVEYSGPAPEWKPKERVPQTLMEFLKSRK